MSNLFLFFQTSLFIKVLVLKPTFIDAHRYRYTKNVYYYTRA